MTERSNRQAWPTDRETIVREFVDQILHGDDNHKAWLIRAGEDYIQTGKVTTKETRVVDVNVRTVTNVEPD